MAEKAAQDGPAQSEPATSGKARQFPCPTCFKGFKSKQQLIQHSLVHSGERKHTCQYCDKAFKQLCHLQQHHRIHTGTKPYKCNVEGCGRLFAQLSNLQHHIRNHDEQVKKAANRQHQCVICHRSYTNESSLKSHTLKMHVHIKPVQPAETSDTPTRQRKRKTKNTQLFTSPTMVPIHRVQNENESGSTSKETGPRDLSTNMSGDKVDRKEANKQALNLQVEQNGGSSAVHGRDNPQQFEVSYNQFPKDLSPTTQLSINNNTEGCTATSSSQTPQQSSQYGDGNGSEIRTFPQALGLTPQGGAFISTIQHQHLMSELPSTQASGSSYKVYYDSENSIRQHMSPLPPVGSIAASGMVPSIQPRILSGNQNMAHTLNFTPLRP